MDIYTVNANDLAICMKHGQKLSNIKKPGNMQNYLSIDNDYLSKLCFNETLTIVNEKEEELGELIGKIRACNSNTSSPSMMINLQSKSISDYGEETGMSVITNTATSFESYEEKWSQWYSKKTEVPRKTVFISKKSCAEPITICTVENDGELIDQTKNNNLKYINNLLTEGMNYAFLRYLAIIGFEGSIKSKKALTINGRLCETTYKCLIIEKCGINDICIPMVVIKRFLYRKEFLKNPINRTTTILTRAGFILKHIWDNKPNKKLIIKKSMKITENGCVYNDPLHFIKINWVQDIRLKSIYSDKISKMKIKYKNYLETNRIVKHLIVDYIKEILVAKPDNVIQFSIDYFEKFK